MSTEASSSRRQSPLPPSPSHLAPSLDAPHPAASPQPLDPAPSFSLGSKQHLELGTPLSPPTLPSSMPCSRSASATSTHSASSTHGSLSMPRRQSSARFEASLKMKATLSASTAERVADSPSSALPLFPAPSYISNTALSIPESSLTASATNLHPLVPSHTYPNAHTVSPVRSPIRSSSMSGNRAASAGSLTNASSGRIRAQTSAIPHANAHSHYQSNGSPFTGTRSMRASPQMRAASQSHAPIPSLHGMGSAVSAPLSAPGSAYAAASPNHPAASGPQWERHTAELTNCIVAFLSPILPTEEEYRIKEATRRQLERLANRVSPGAKLLAFGSMANGFALRNSDMDLCCLLGNMDGKLPTTQQKAELVETLGQLIRQETDFTVMPLPKARVPIIKINRPSTAELPYEIACDIGFENRLALENTRLLLSYAMVDPQRLRTLVLFVKVWAKRRKLNSPYTGTLSSYGYTLLVLYFLVHVKRPAVLPNLQRVTPTRPMRPDEMELEGSNIYFYDDVATLRKQWSSQNTDSVGELLVDFFRFFSKDFSYARDVISLKSESGLLSKDGVSWNSELCIEDPFSRDYNVSRTVTKDGLYTIRGEFMRATRMLTSMRGQKISVLIAELCEEREESLTRAPDGPVTQRYHQPQPRSRDMYTLPRRVDPSVAGNSGYGGSFAFEQMARGLGQGIAFPPTAAMLAPLSRSHGLSPKPPLPSFAHRQRESGFSSAQSDSGSGVGPDLSHVGFRHASARTSPSFKHALPSGYSGAGAQEAFAYGAEISFGPDSVGARRDHGDSLARGKSSRSFSETLNRSKSLPRSNAGEVLSMAKGPVRPSAAQVHAAAMQTPVASANHDPVAVQHQQQYSQMQDFETRMSGLSVQSANSMRRLSSSSAASSCAQYDSNGSSAVQCSSASSPWSLGNTVGDVSRTAHPQADTLELVQEYLRRSAFNDSEQEYDVDDSISEGTLDELARLSEFEDVDNHVSPLDDATTRHKALAATAAAAAASGIARKDRQH